MACCNDLGVHFYRPESASTNLKPQTGPRKGMQLGKAKKANDFLDTLRAEGENIQVTS